MNNKIVLSVSNVSKSFEEKQVLKDISFKVNKSEVFVILGQSGVGKSVLLKTIMGVIAPDTGEIIVNDLNTTNISLPKRVKMNLGMGMLFQGSALFDSLTVMDNVIFSKKLKYKMTKKEAEIIALESMCKVGLDETSLYKYPASLSGGMQKRVALARLLSDFSDILFFDEPTSGLDPVMSNTIGELIQKVTKELNATSCVITHDIKIAKKIADNIILIHDGKIAWQGTPEEMEKSKNTTLNYFLEGIQ